MFVYSLAVEAYSQRYPRYNAQSIGFTVITLPNTIQILQGSAVPAASAKLALACIQTYPKSQIENKNSTESEKLFIKGYNRAYKERTKRWHALFIKECF
jgi:hypothetical protein